MSRSLTIDIVSDAICPWCYVGKRRLEKAIASLKRSSGDVDVQVRWRPFFLDHSLPREGVDKMERYAAKFGEARMRQMIPYMQQVGRDDGIAFSVRFRAPAAARALLTRARGAVPRSTAARWPTRSWRTV